MIRRIVLSLAPLVLAACGPTGIGAGIASLFGGDNGVDPSVKPVIALSVVESTESGAPLHQTQMGVFAGPELPITFRVDRSGGAIGDLKTFLVALTEPDQTIDTAKFEKLEDPDIDPSGFLKISEETLLSMFQPNNAQIQSGVYQIQVKARDEHGREGFSGVALEWTYDGEAPVQPSVTAVARSSDASQLDVKWQVDASDPGAAKKEFKRYEVLYLPAAAGTEPKDLVDPAPGGQGNQGQTARHAVPDEAAPFQEQSGVYVRDEDVNATTGDCTTTTLYVAVVGIDYAENRSVVSVDKTYTAGFESETCEGSDFTPKGDYPAKDGGPGDAQEGQTDHGTDFNGDGCPDSTTIPKDGSEPSIAIALCEGGRPTGKLADAVSVPFDASLGVISDLAVFSLHDDLLPDLAAISRASKRVGIYVNRGDRDQPAYEFLGAVDLPDQIRDNYSPRSIVSTADVNGDGYQDILIRADHDTDETQGDYMVAYLGTGKNGRGDGDPADYVPVLTNTGLRARESLRGNFNGDTFGDLALTDGKVVRVLLGAGDGDTPPRATGGYAIKRLVVPEGGPEFLAKGDLNGDGIDDIVTSNAGGTVSVVRGVADGNFDVPDTFSALPTAPAIAQVVSPGAGPLLVADTNGDGIQDVVVGGAAPDTVSVLIGGGANGKWDGTFDEVNGFPVGFQPAHISIADFDGDDVLDVVVVDDSGLKSALLSGVGYRPRAQRTFSAGPRLSTPLHNSDAVVITDLNGDSIADIVAAGTRTGAGIYTIFEGTGTNGLATGAFEPGLTRGGGDSTELSLLTGDFNRDATPDLVIASAEGNDVQFGGFSEVDQRYLFSSDKLYAFPDAVNQTIVGDFNHDGILDLVSRTGAYVRVLMGKNTDGRTDGRFLFEDVTPEDLLPVGDVLRCGEISDYTGLFGELGTGITFPLDTLQTPGAIGSADFDGDGGLDVLVVDEGNRRLAILRNYGRDCGDHAHADVPGFGMFEPAVSYPAGPDGLPFVPGPMVITDFDFDGVPDVAALAKDPGQANETFCVLLGQREDAAPGDIPSLAKFSFGGAVPFGSGGNPRAIGSGDLDQDGDLDLIVVDGTTAVATVFWSNGDGTFTLGPVLSTGLTSPRAVAVADLNGDRVPDIAVAGDEGVQIIFGDGGLPPG